jgi:TonB family protein
MENPARINCLLVILFFLILPISSYSANEDIQNPPRNIAVLFEGDNKAIQQFWDSYERLAEKSGLKLSMVEDGSEMYDCRLVLELQKKKFVRIKIYRKNALHYWFSFRHDDKKPSAKLIEVIAEKFVEVLKELQHYEFSMNEKGTWALPNQPPEEIKSQTIYRIGATVSSPGVISRVDPAYTERARAAKMEGIVVFQAIVRKIGTIEIVKVVQPLPFGLTESAQQALNQWKFMPAKKGEEPVDAVLKIEVNFTLR